LNIEYALTSGVLLPTRWTSCKYSPSGKVKQSTECTVTYSDVNGEVDDAEFEIEIPANAIIIDERKAQSF
jgi:outer membrane lipoprotein-sorting protein